MNKLFTILFSVALFAQFAFADGPGWIFEKVLFQYDLEVSNSYGMHGVAVDPDGNIWTGMYNYPTDTIIVGTDTTIAYGCRVFSPDGTELAISPVNILTGAVTDTITSSCRGLARAADGNILLSVAGKIYKINYQTGEGMAIYDYPGYSGSLTKAAVAGDGKIFIGTVGKGNPVKILDADLNEIGNALDEYSGAYNRAVAVTADGKDLYLGSTWLGIGIPHYHSDIPGVLPYQPVDTLGNAIIDGVYDTTMTVTCDTTISGSDTTITCDTTYTVTPHEEKFWAEDITIGPDSLLYAADTQIDFGYTTYRGSRWWVFDLKTGEELYSLGDPEGDPSAGGIWNGRGAAWSADGNTMYLADFGYNNVTVWKKATAIDEGKPHVLSTFELLQNFPNPFNPTTTIPYRLSKRARVELTVYTTTGQKVATLVNEVKNAGEYEYKFDGSQLASGMYIYNLKVDGKTLTKRMILVK